MKQPDDSGMTGYLLSGYLQGVEIAKSILDLEYYSDGKRSTFELPAREDGPMTWEQRIEYLKGLKGGIDLAMNHKVADDGPSGT